MVIFAGHGYIFLAPDLTGFGASTAPRHRYLHADTEAKSTLDMWIAVQQYELYRHRSDGRLFNTGYSQGGHTALAFAAAAKAAGVEITATSVGGAVSEPDAWFAWGIEQVDSSYLQVYPADLLLSYNDVYGDVYRDPAAAFASPFDVELEQLFDMNHTYDRVVAGLPGSTAELTTPAFFAAIHDPSSPIRVHLRENAVDDVCLDHPIRMFHMIDDDEVPYEISLDALARLAACNEVELIDWIGTDHLNTWHQTLPEVRKWFDSF
jgi:pimeloyl-ACP methyl ester carboxylesterase